MGDLGEATIIVGDPGRVELISQDWRDKKKLVDSREFVVVSGFVEKPFGINLFHRNWFRIH